MEEFEQIYLEVQARRFGLRFLVRLIGKLLLHQLLRVAEGNKGAVNEDAVQNKAHAGQNRSKRLLASYTGTKFSHFQRLNVNNIIGAHQIIGRGHDVAAGKVNGDDFGAMRVLANDLYGFAVGYWIQIACIGQGFENGEAILQYHVFARTHNLAQDRKPYPANVYANKCPGKKFVHFGLHLQLGLVCSKIYYQHLANYR